MLGTVVLVGRPNVGKSTLFNRLIQRRAAIIKDIPGTGKKIVKHILYSRINLFICDIIYQI